MTQICVFLHLYYHFYPLYLVVDQLLRELFYYRYIEKKKKKHISFFLILLAVEFFPCTFAFLTTYFTVSSSDLWWLPSARIHLWLDSCKKALIENSFTLFPFSFFLCLKVHQFPMFLTTVLYCLCICCLNTVISSAFMTVDISTWKIPKRIFVMLTISEVH